MRTPGHSEGNRSGSHPRSARRAGRRLGRRAATAAATIALAAAAAAAHRPPAAAAELRIQANAFLSAGGTDNALSAPSGTARAAPDVFFLVRGGLLSVWRLPHGSHSLAYTYGIAAYGTQVAAGGQTHALSWSWNNTVTARLDVMAAFSATYSRLNSTAPLQDAAAQNAMPTAVPAGPVAFGGLNATTGLTYRPSARLSWYESTSAGVFAPVSDPEPRGLAVQQQVGHSRQYGQDALTANLVLSYLLAREIRDSFDIVTRPQRQTVHATLLGGWRRELTRTMGLSLQVGGLGATLVEGGPIVVGPAWNGSLSYTRPEGSASVAVMRAVQPNIYIGQATIGDGVVARVGLPIDRQERFSVAGWGGVQRARLVTSTSSFDTAFDLISGAASLRYRSRQYPFGMSLDYSIHAQRGYAVQGRIFPDLRRQVVLLTVSGSWPPDRGGR